MKKWAVSLIGTGLLLIAAVLIIGTFQQHHQSVPSRGRSLAAVSPATSKQNQVLVVYLSRTGHTRRVATDLH